LKQLILKLPIYFSIFVSFHLFQLKVNSEQDFIIENLSKKIETEKVIKFENLKDLLLKNNKDILAAKSKISESNFNLRSLQSQWYPSLSLTSSAIPKYISGYTKNNLAADTSTQQVQKNISANLEWDIYNPSRIPSIKEGFYNLKIAKLDLTRLTRDLHLETIRQFFLIKKVSQDINISEQALQVSNFSLIEAEDKLKAGIGNKLEVLEARTQLKRDELMLIKQFGELKKEKRNLANILNLNEEIKIDIDKKTNLMGFWSSSIDESIENALNNRISLQRLKFSELANKEKAKSIIGGKKPRLSLYNSYSISSSDGELNVQEPNSSKNSRNETNTVGIQLNWLLFDGGGLNYSFKGFKEKGEQIDAQYKKSKQEIQESLSGIK